MKNLVLQALKFSPLFFLLLGGTTVSAQSLPPYAGTTCSAFATHPEAQWHYAMGTAPSSVDDDRDGLACEHLTSAIRSDGSRIFNNQANRGNVRYTMEVWRVNATDVYLRIKSSQGMDFTTRSFPSDPAAREHMNTYYRNLLR
ncbi:MULTISPECIES: hypothetical protein [Cyanophyceae]|uniref:hypothetical protein n=1 Tax=Cyanophyceae TaxID=3028117 RepID=UPI00168471EF|nr:MULTISPECIES: hypothetical protein [Cyanophyceae]MBD1914270.1 hypothetical protein [Phormidium sp. FACHB-77]MBD2031205.1 hypothetical protein [Phormidium sp. FACHB-322]MBD2049604.1 hypothetical protein [Leptolyngbya sp. FACHB-60]